MEIAGTFIFAFLIGFGAAVFYYNSVIRNNQSEHNTEIRNLKEAHNEDLNLVKKNFSDAHKQIIYNTVLAIIKNNPEYSSLPFLTINELVVKHSPTVQYNLYNVEHCTYDNILNSLEYCAKIYRSILLIQKFTPDSLRYATIEDLYWEFSESLPLEELTEEYARRAVEEYLMYNKED